MVLYVLKFYIDGFFCIIIVFLGYTRTSTPDLLNNNFRKVRPLYCFKRDRVTVMSSKTIDSSISAGQYDLYTCTVSTGKNIICQKLNIPVCSLKPKLANCTRQEIDLVRDYVRTVQSQ